MNTNASSQLKTSLGPVLYYWNREQLLNFYLQVAESDIDVVYVGEAVCSKRRTFRTDDWISLARDLVHGTGKEVVLSSLTLIEAESELGTLRRQVRALASEPGVLLEANDFGAVQAAHDAGLRFVAGHTLNVYNAETLARLVRYGAVRWVPPVELSREAIGDVITAARRSHLAVETEVFAWGRLPLAHSARCFTARAHNLPKDQCEFRCGSDVEGLALKTREGAPLFRLNGIQTQSEQHCNLFGEAADIASRGIDILRISVSTPDCWPTIRRLLASLHTRDASLTAMDADLCNGYWFGEAGIAPGRMPA